MGVLTTRFDLGAACAVKMSASAFALKTRLTVAVARLHSDFVITSDVEQIGADG